MIFQYYFPNITVEDRSIFFYFAFKSNKYESEQKVRSESLYMASQTWL